MTKARDNADNWAADITGVTAGTGITGGGTSGTVTVTNSLLTTIDAAGDLLYGTGADTATRLAIGTAGQVLQVNSGATAPEWVTAASGGYTSLVTGSLSGSSLDLQSISGSYKNLRLILRDFSLTGGQYSGGESMRLTVNNTSNIYFATSGSNSGALTNVFNLAGANIVGAGDGDNTFILDFLDYANTSTVKYIFNRYAFENTAGNSYFVGQDNGAADLTAAINRITVTALGTATFDAGTYELFGEN